MRNSQSKRVAMVLLTSMLLPSAVIAAVNTAIIVSLEEPAVDGVYGSISNLRGWAVAPTGITKIELYIDGVYRVDIPAGGARADVGGAYPGYPGSSNSGFSMAYNYKNLSVGQHTATTRAYDGNGDYNDGTSTFTATKFNSNFISDSSQIDVSGATITALDGNRVQFAGMQAEGTTWNMVLSWDRPSQAFQIASISTVGGIAGNWSMTVIDDERNCGEGINTDTYPVTISVNDSQVTVDDGVTSDMIGTTSGNLVNVSYSKPEDGGTLTSTGTITVVGDAFTGLLSWTWTDGASSCSGNSTLTASRL